MDDNGPQGSDDGITRAEIADKLRAHLADFPDATHDEILAFLEGEDSAMRDDGKQWRVALSLDGQGTSTLEQTTRWLIEVLRSGDRLAPHLRDALALALERGQINSAGVRVLIQAEPGYFKALSTMASDKRLIDAGRYIAKQSQTGRSYESIYRDLSEMFGVSDVRDFGIRARKIFMEFRAYCDLNAERIERECGYDPRGNGLDEDDCYYPARAKFAEAKIDLYKDWS
jgi:hypothetical protein